MADEEREPVESIRESKPRFLPRPSVTKNTDRLTVTLQIHHEHYGSESVSFPAAWDQKLELQEQPVPRRIKVTKEWKPLNLGWLEPEQVGYILIDNQTGKFNRVLPDEEEKKIIASSFVEITNAGDDESFLIAPNSTWGPCKAKNPGKLKIRGAFDGIEIVVYVFPR